MYREQIVYPFPFKWEVRHTGMSKGTIIHNEKELVAELTKVDNAMGTIIECPNIVMMAETNGELP